VPFDFVANIVAIELGSRTQVTQFLDRRPHIALVPVGSAFRMRATISNVTTIQRPALPS
jgi:hypothetical protein